MINDLLHPSNHVFRAEVKGLNSPIYQKFFVYICIFVIIKESNESKYPNIPLYINFRNYNNIQNYNMNDIKYEMKNVTLLVLRI